MKANRGKVVAKLPHEGGYVKDIYDDRPRKGYVDEDRSRLVVKTALNQNLDVTMTSGEASRNRLAPALQTPDRRRKG